MHIGADFERFIGLEKTKKSLRQAHKEALSKSEIDGGFTFLDHYLENRSIESPEIAEAVAKSLLVQGANSVAFDMMRGIDGLHEKLSRKTSGEGFLHIDVPFLYYSPTVDEALTLARFPKILRVIKRDARLEGRQRVLEALTGSPAIAQTILSLEKPTALRFTKDIRTNVAGELHLVATKVTGVDIGLTFDGDAPSYSYLYVHQLGTLHSLAGNRTKP